MTIVFIPCLEGVLGFFVGFGVRVGVRVGVIPLFLPFVSSFVNDCNAPMVVNISAEVFVRLLVHEFNV